MKCQTLVVKKHQPRSLGEQPCGKPATMRVRSDPQPGWSGVHCSRHAGKVVEHQAFQVLAGITRIVVERL